MRFVAFILLGLLFLSTVHALPPPPPLTPASPGGSDQTQTQITTPNEEIIQENEEETINDLLSQEQLRQEDGIQHVPTQSKTFVVASSVFMLLLFCLQMFLLWYVRQILSSTQRLSIEVSEIQKELHSMKKTSKQPTISHEEKIPSLHIEKEEGWDEVEKIVNRNT